MFGIIGVSLILILLLLVIHNLNLNKELGYAEGKVISYKQQLKKQMLITNQALVVGELAIITAEDTMLLLKKLKKQCLKDI